MQTKKYPNFIIVGGTTGTGKSTIGALLAKKLNYSFLDGDDFHSAESKEKMAKGIGLTDEDRLPWLQVLKDLSKKHSHLVLACSSLKKSYRLILKGSIDRNDIKIFLLFVPKDEITVRLTTRHNHYAKANLLNSQFKALEIPDSNEDYCQIIDGNQEIDHVIAEIIQKLEHKNKIFTFD